MRYTFQQFLELQNELNAKLDEELVEKSIDGILNELEQHIRRYPTSHKYVDTQILDRGYFYRDLGQLTASEQNAIFDYLRDMGFRVELDSRFWANDTMTISW